MVRGVSIVSSNSFSDCKVAPRCSHYLVHPDKIQLTQLCA